MNGIIIVNQEIGHNVYKIKRFTEEGKKLGVSLSTYINDGTLAIVKNDNLTIININHLSIKSILNSF